MRSAADRAAELLAAVRGRRLCVVGDLLLDRYVWGRAERISPEAPVPIVVHERTTHRASGAAIAAQVAAGLGGRVEMVAVVGGDDEGRLAGALVAGLGARPELVLDDTRPTTLKTRVWAGGQQVVRIDREDARDLEARAEGPLRARALAAVGRADAVLVSDYAKGVCTEGVVRPVIEAARSRGLPVVVDPKLPDPGRYAGATVVTPNELEFARFAGRLGCGGEPLAAAAGRLREAGRFDWVLVTRAAEGMTLVGPGSVDEIPASAARAVDVSGAGDAVAATLALCLGAGVPAPDAARLGSLVAGVVVGQLVDRGVDPDAVRIAAGHRSWGA